MDKLLSEAWASPFGLTKEITLDGEPLYSSETLKKKLSEILSKQLGVSSGDITKLISKGKLTPVYSAGNAMTIGMRRLFGADSNGMVDRSKGNAFYVPKNKTIFIVIDNNVSKLGFVDDKWIAMICVHEMMHLCTKLDAYHTWSTFKEDLYNYYINFYSLFLNIDDKNDEFINLVKQHVFKMFKTEVRTDDQKLSEIILKQGHFLLKILEFSRMNKDEADEAVKDMIGFIHHLHPKYNLSYYDNYKTGKLLRQAYKNLTGKVPDFSFCYQELYTPSEVISIMSAFNRSKPLQLIKSLANKL